VLKVVHDGGGSNELASLGESLLDEIVRDGARRMLAAALQAEVAAYIEAHAGEVDADGHRLVVRNGYHQQREVTRAAGGYSAMMGWRAQTLQRSRGLDTFMITDVCARSLPARPICANL
jgi:hypothetical protein